MNAAIEPREIIEQASRDGLAILRGDAPGKLKLRGAAEAVAKWKPLVAQHKTDILPLVEASNDDTPTIEALLAAHGDGSAAGVDWSAWRLTTATRSATWAVINRRGLTLLFTVEPIPQPRSYPQAWPVERIAPWPDVEADAEDFEERAGILEFDAGLAREAAEREARRLIEASRWCSGCRHMDALRRPDDARPHCAIGHALTWRQIGPGGVLTRPGRSDARNCGDRNSEPGI